MTLRLISVFTVLMLHGCTGLFHTPSTPTPLLQMSTNSQIDHWQLRGKIGLRQNTKAYSAYLNWQQCGEHFDIRLSGPLGQGAAHLFGDRNTVTLNRGHQAPITAQNPEQLLTQELGWSLPVSQLLYWIRGIPEPGKPFIKSTTQTGFKQSNWQLSYPVIQAIEGYSLPTKTIAKQPSLTVTLLLKHWNLEPNCAEIP